MRVLVLDGDPGVPVFGPKGASVHLRSMATAMTRLGHQVFVAAARTGDRGAAPAFQVLPDLGAPPPGLSPLETERHLLHGGGELRRRLRQVARAVRPELIYERHSLWCEAGVEIAREVGVPHLLEVNAPLIDESLRFRTLHQPDQAEGIARRVFAGTGMALAVSSAVAAYVRRLGGRRVRLFPNAVDAALFPNRPRERDGTDGPKLGFCGSLRPWHGVEALADVLAAVRRSVPDATLIVVGDGPGRDALERRATRLGVQQGIQAAGAVEHDEVPHWLDRMDVALAPYPPLDRFWFSPLKLFEYQAASLPVIATRQGDLPLHIEHGRTGILVEPDDVAGMARWVVALHRDRGLARAIGTAARREVLRHHTWERRVAEIEALTGRDPVRNGVGA